MKLSTGLDTVSKGVYNCSTASRGRFEMAILIAKNRLSEVRVNRLTYCSH